MDSIISHVSIGTNQFDQAITFYDQVMATLGYGRIMELPCAIAYGKKFPEFWVQLPHDNQPASVGNGTHIAFLASSKEEVDAFHAAALATGGVDDGAPGPRPEGCDFLQRLPFSQQACASQFSVSCYQDTDYITLF